MLAGIPPLAGDVSGYGLGACSVSGHRASEGRRRCEMKGRLVAFVGVFCIALLIVSGAYADKPDKGDKPGNPGNIETELIVFTGDDLQGWAHVEGCCPNAGPFPEYTMHLPNGLANMAGGDSYPSGTYHGELFIAGYGGPHADQTIVQFHACCTGSEYHDDYSCTNESLPTLSFEIIGGTPESSGKKKDRVHTVTFENDPYWLDWDRGTAAGEVSFKITIAPSSCTEEICTCEKAIPDASQLCQ